MLAVLADSPTCVEGIACITGHITLGRIPPAVRRHITATRLIALFQGERRAQADLHGRAVLPYRCWCERFVLYRTPLVTF